MAVLVNREAPDFETKAVIVDKSETLRLSDYRGKKYVLLFFYPMDFTFVCPTELHAFQSRLAEFDALDTQVIGASVDSEHCHHAWLKTPKINGGIQGVTYPLIADVTKQISRAFDVLIEEAGVALRGLFLIDKQGIVQHQVVNNLSLGRSVDEALRIVKALQFTEKHGEVCPADWHEGQKALTPDRSGIETFYSS